MITLNRFFARRCGFAQPRCVERLPPNVVVGDRIARCILAEGMAAVAT